jgi:GTP-binding protein
MNVAYITSAAKPDQLPKESLPEIAVIGRSNCGKSTLINALTGNQKIARASRTPGRTQMANFFSVDERKYLVDLPGYGFSKAEAPNRKFWQQLVDSYLNRGNIQHVLFLFDCRRTLDETDLELLRDISSRHPTLFVLTKTDKLTQSEMHQLKQRFADFPQIQRLGLAEVYLTSSTKMKGIPELRNILFV